MTHADDAAVIRRTLFQLGHELPGHRLERLAAQLLATSRSKPTTSANDLVEQAVSAIEDGPTALVAEEPDLLHVVLDPPAATVEQGATTVVTALGQQLLAAYRRS